MITIVSEPFVLIGAIAALGILYVLLPVGMTIYRKVRGPRAVCCPETGEPEVVEVDAARAVSASLFGHEDIEIVRCSRWPEHADCDRECVKQIH